MKTSAVIRIVLYSVVALLLTGALVFGIAYPNMSAFLSDEIEFFDDKDESFTSSMGESITIDSDIRKIEIEWTSGEVEFVKTTSDAVTLCETSSVTVTEKNRLVYSVSGDSLKIKYNKNAKSSLFGVNNSDAKTLTVELPDKLYNEISVETVSASVKIPAVAVKSLDIETVSGDVRAEGVRADTADCETVSGAINFSGVMNLSGSFDAVSGDISVFLPRDASFRADFETVSGKFTTDFETRRTDDEYICGTGEVELEFDTVSGDAKVGKQ